MKKLIVPLIVILFVWLSYIFIGNFLTTSIFLQDYGSVISFLILLVVILCLPLFTIKVFRTNTSKLAGIGKGLIVGSVLSAIYDVIDLYVIKQFIIKGCSDWCGIENILLLVIPAAYFIIGLVIFAIAKIKNRNNLTSI